GEPRPAPIRGGSSENPPKKTEPTWEPITTVIKDTPPEENGPGQGRHPEDIEASTTPVMKIWENGQVDVLEKPNVTARITGTLPPGARVTHFKDVGSFYQIEYGGLKGFVYKDFCKILK
ncbi:MAG: SH3 domain-containing protein, partial [Deltaproteobacteria bacterium]|nr:SH3 domain-containing protein [Deltaproteobacteria bacterium]